MPHTSRMFALYPVLGKLPPDLGARVATQSQALRVAQGLVVFDERQACQGLPLILSGGIRVTKPAPTGRELPLYQVLPGDSCIISTSCLLEHRDYHARGITVADTELMLMPQPLFEELIGVPAFRDFVFHLFSARIADLMQLIEEVAFRKMDQRLAGRLLGHGPQLRLTHQQLADELGSVREIVSRLLKGFAEQGLVRLGREQVEILDAIGLRRIATGA